MPDENQTDIALALHFLPPDLGARVRALAEFGSELARARLIASEPTLAAIRLQYWSDTIEKIYAQKPVSGNPMAETLARLIGEHGLPQSRFAAMIDAHMDSLAPAPFTDWAQLMGFVDATSANVLRLCLMSCGLGATLADALAQPGGQAWGLAELMRALPKWAARRSHWLPTNDVSGRDGEDLFAGNATQPVLATLSEAQARIQLARKALNLALRQIPIGDLFPILAPIALANRHGDVATPKLGPNWVQGAPLSLLERQVRLTWAVARRRV
ncbi:MAG: hypothetical protein RLZZ157_263 [Pseudomonadota bacterium]